jgi:ligand-binding sensor domain-containing protein
MISGESPFEFAATLDEIFPGSGSAYFRSASDGSVWLISDPGIARLTDLGWKVYLPSGYGRYFVGIDTLGRAWYMNEIFPARPSAIRPGAIHANLNISAWDGTKWTTYSSDSGWISFSIDPPAGFSMAESHGLIWVSTVGDVRVFDGSRWKVVHTKDISLTPPLFVESFADGDDVWVTGCDSDIYWYDQSGWHSKSMPEGSGCISRMHEDRQSNVWLVVDNTLWRFTRATKEWTPYTLPELQSRYITSMTFNEAGKPWFIAPICDSQRGCTGSTLYYLQNDIWIPTSPLNPSSRFFSVLIAPTDQVWVSGTDGVYQIVNDQPKLVSYLRVSSWAMDKAGKIWVIGNDPSTNNKLSLWVVNP